MAKLVFIGEIIMLMAVIGNGVLPAITGALMEIGIIIHGVEIEGVLIVMVITEYISMETDGHP